MHPRMELFQHKKEYALYRTNLDCSMNATMSGESDYGLKLKYFPAKVQLVNEASG